MILGLVQSSPVRMSNARPLDRNRTGLVVLAVTISVRISVFCDLVSFMSTMYHIFAKSQVFILRILGIFCS